MHAWHEMFCKVIGPMIDTFVSHNEKKNDFTVVLHFRNNPTYVFVPIVIFNRNYLITKKRIRSRFPALHNRQGQRFISIYILCTVSLLIFFVMEGNKNNAPVDVFI